MKSSNKGFTLAELLLAAAILALALTSILTLFINCLFLNTSNNNLSIATSHGQYTLESVKNTNFTSIQSQTWDQTAISAKGLTPLDSESIVIGVTGTDVLDVVVTVNWKDRGIRNRSLTLETLIAEP
jgi:prepilin-type N-terminal cleavage/methylation domain-containing protein